MNNLSTHTNAGRYKMTMPILECVSPMLQEDLLVAVHRHGRSAFVLELGYSEPRENGTVEKVGVHDHQSQSLAELRETVVLGESFGLPLMLYYLSEALEAVEEQANLSRLRDLQAKQSS